MTHKVYCLILITGMSCLVFTSCQNSSEGECSSQRKLEVTNKDLTSPLAYDHSAQWFISSVIIFLILAIGREQ